ncbi:uncharacterized protein [Dysidea avara]|uniref:uncharacterized protein n=1 Tax=Dysidea avara TaxID=196820 RepID=UPI00332F2A9C
MNHLNSNNILIDTQHNFRSQHSCVTQLISLIEDLSYALDQQKQTDAILFDFAKAFDSVPHQRLLVKLRHYGINDHICQWVNTWLTRSRESYFSRSIKDWNNLPSSIIESNNIDSFLAEL